MPCTADVALGRGAKGGEGMAAGVGGPGLVWYPANWMVGKRQFYRWQRCIPAPVPTPMPAPVHTRTALPTHDLIVNGMYNGAEGGG
mmetsp:Transcript_71878/g.126653  ORF Transcript_71878/g.126653 Transcript_71878/m.126653 type:complete len:86 (+) Transcript_71878:141-398(+)